MDSIMENGSSSDSVPESEISDWLVKLINDEELYQSIAGKEDIERLAGITSQQSFIPSFTIDYLSRMACAKAADHVLSQLSLLEIIAVNKSISLQTGEILKPDIIAFNPESRTIVIFEIKRSVQTERQAVTELMAYEQEVQNNLPFLSNCELCFVVVARDWSTLMDHAVGSIVTWSNKQCLALKLDVGADDMKLSCHLPASWRLLGNVNIPEAAIQSVDLVLYNKKDSDPEEWPPATVMTAMEMIARNGDRINAHGFLMLWEDYGGWGAARWIITICAIDPISLFFWSNNPNNPFAPRQSELSHYLQEKAGDLALGDLPSSAMKIANDAISILEPEFSAQWENFNSWHDKLHLHRARAFPLQFQFWGKPGEYIRQLVVHPDVRERLMPYIQREKLDWTHPYVAYPVIEEITGRWPFRQGIVSCSDLFELGQVLSLLYFLHRNEQVGDEENPPWQAYTRWVELRSMCFMIEMAQIYYSSETIDVPLPHLSSDPEKRLKSIDDVTNWIEKNLIDESETVHQLCFYLGRCSSVFMDEMFSSLWELEQFKNSRMDAEQGVRNLLEWIMANYNYRAKEGSATPEDDEHFERIKSTLLGNTEFDMSNESSVETALSAISGKALIENIRSLLLPTANLYFGNVYHKAYDTDSIDIDWQWLKDGIRQMFDAGAKRPAVTRDQAGHLGTMELSGPFYGVLIPITDPSKDVYFLDQMAGHSFAVKMTWEDLMDDVFGKK